jgi:hypothetical protein
LKVKRVLTGKFMSADGILIAEEKVILLRRKNWKPGNVEKPTKYGLMGINVTINVMGTKGDVQKLWDTLCEPNEYGGTGIRLDRNSIRTVEGTAFPLWEAKGETDKMPERDDEFKNLYADFSALSIHLSIYSDNEKTTAYWYGANGVYDDSHIYKQLKSLDLLTDHLKDIFDKWKTLKYVPETVTKTEAMCLEAVRQDQWSLEYVPEELKTEKMCLDAVGWNGMVLLYVPDQFKTVEMCLKAVRNAVYHVRKLKTTEMYLETMYRNGQGLQLVPDKLKAPVEALLRKYIVLKKHRDESYTENFSPIIWEVLASIHEEDN